MLKKILKITGLILLLVLLAGFLFWLNIQMKWPWWMGASIFIGVIGIVVAIIFLKRYLLRRREKKFVRRVVELDEAAIKDLPLQERQQLKDLQDKWKEAVELLRDSYLRKRGNPLYALPWYLVIGESGSGKTSAIKNARLSSPLSEIARSAGIAATANCDWWFFEEAIILDSAGRYTIPVDEKRDREEWEKFLILLSQYRRREPLNGLVLVVAADTLLAGDGDKLRLDGQSTRKRIDQLMRVVGAKFPVYILVTKMDLVFGFVEFLNSFGAEEASQAMGYMNRQGNPYWHETLAAAWSYLTSRLHELRLIMAHRKQDPAAAALLFPEEFERLRPGLEEFVKAVFAENPYQETPHLRGLYFSSARQESTPAPGNIAFMETASREIPATGRDLFLKDFFRIILPGDRVLFRPLLEFIRWRRLTSNTALMAWLLICLSLCGFLTMSYIRNHMTINSFHTDIQALKLETDKDEVMNLIRIERLRLEILDLEKANRYWFIPRLGLDESLEVEDRIKSRYVHLFRDGILRGFDLNLGRYFNEVSKTTPEDELANFFGFTITRIKLLKEFLKSGKLVHDDVFEKSSADLMRMIHPQTAPEVAALFDDNYYAALKWNPDRRKNETELELCQFALDSLQKKTVNFKWLVKKWIPNAADVQLKDFWGEPESTGFITDVMVPGAYTAEGRKHIENFLKVMEGVTDDKKAFSRNKADFWSWYEQEFTNAWTFFARRFPDAENGLQTQASQRTMATLMTTEHNPYFSLLQRIAEETSWIDGPRLPPWIAVVTELNEVHKLYKSNLQKAKGTIVGKLTGEAEQLTQQFTTDIRKEKLEVMKKRLAMEKIWKDYLTSLDKIVPAATSQEVAYRMAADFFTLPADAKESTAAIYLAYGNYLKIKGTITQKGDLNDAWDILIGPLDYLIDYCIRQTACYLKQQWESQVGGGIQGSPKDKLPVLLFDKTNGLVWKYVGGPAGPFLTKSPNGYLPRKAMIRSGNELFVPFTQEFLEFLNSGAEGILVAQPEYLVTMETLPIEVNNDARLDPYANFLTLQCTESQVTLKNYNYPQKATIRWSPDKCGDTTLQVLFPNLTLTKTYSGRLGFAQFLADFKNGRKTYTAEDFPGMGPRLKDLGIDSIKVSYKITGAKPVLQLLKKLPGGLPGEIVKCEAK